MSESVRLNKWIAQCGLTSRRKADEWIDEGLVKVNGKITYELGVRIDPKKDKITVKGKPLRPQQKFVYIAFNKPKNVLTSMADPEGRTTVADFFAKSKVRLFPVGRLDWDTEGLLLMTNDGEFANHVMHPKKEIPKTYIAKLDGSPSMEQLFKLKKGVSIPGGKAKALHISKVKKGKSDKYDWVKVIITEGRNRQVRKMFEKIGFDVKKLQRTAIGHLKLGTLKRGEARELRPSEVASIFEPLQKRSSESRSRSRLNSKPGRKKVGKSKIQPKTKKRR